MRMKKDKYLVSVIIVNYNNAKYLQRSLDSVINQQYKDKEIIIVDDMSTDKSNIPDENILYMTIHNKL